MRGFLLGDFDHDPERERRDTELTLGSGTLLAIFFGLVLICGLCFGMGYAVGRHTAGPSSITPPRPASEQEPLQASGVIPKPSAVAQTPLASTSAENPFARGNTASASSALTPPGSHGASPAPAQQPQTPVVQSYMVQIAAVANPEDADVLMSALKKRDYPVTAYHDPGDNFIRVRIGPFTSHAVADQWRTRLQNDGYNAVIQP